MKRTLAVLTALLSLMATAVAGCASGGGASGPSAVAQSGRQHNRGTGPYEGFPAQPPLARPSFVLSDTRGNTYDFGKQTRGKTTFLYFGYTRCPDVCPATMADISAALRTLPARAAKNVAVVFVTTDVDHDTGPVIARWLAHFASGTKGATWVGLRGTRAQVDAAQAASHVFVAQDGGLTHSARLFLFSPDGYAHVTYAATSQEEREIAHDLPIAEQQGA